MLYFAYLAKKKKKRLLERPNTKRQPKIKFKGLIGANNTNLFAFINRVSEPDLAVKKRSIFLLNCWKKRDGEFLAAMNNPPEGALGIPNLCGPPSEHVNWSTMHSSVHSILLLQSEFSKHQKWPIFYLCETRNNSAELSHGSLAYFPTMRSPSFNTPQVKWGDLLPEGQKKNTPLQNKRWAKVKRWWGLLPSVSHLHFFLKRRLLLCKLVPSLAQSRDV